MYNNTNTLAEANREDKMVDNDFLTECASLNRLLTHYALRRRANGSCSQYNRQEKVTFETIHR